MSVKSRDSVGRVPLYTVAYPVTLLRIQTSNVLLTARSAIWITTGGSKVSDVLSRLTWLQMNPWEISLTTKCVSTSCGIPDSSHIWVHLDLVDEHGADDCCTSGRLTVSHDVELLDGCQLLVGGQLPKRSLR